MRKNTALAKLSAGKVTTGILQVHASLDMAEELAHVGFDWIWLDWQHGEWTESTLQNALGRFLNAPSTPLVRVKGLEPGSINRMLDIGAMGIIVPMVQNAEQARAAVQAMYYPPLAMRSGGGNRLGLLSGESSADYYAHANEEVMLVVQVETEEAIANVREIMRVSGVHVVLIGPGDLMIDVKAHGHDAAQHERLVQEMLQTSRETGVAAGYFCITIEEAQRRVAEGFRFVMCALVPRILSGVFRDLHKQSSAWGS